MKHIIHSKDITRESMEMLFARADALREKNDRPLAGKILACLFYEPSTRTRLSFESAMHRLGGAVIGSENAKDSSSAVKGETIEDTIRMISLYADAVVIRHPEEGTAQRAALLSSIPVINAGDGIGQHPTQALLDLYTIFKERGSIDNVRITLVGDLKNGRTAKSLLWALSKFNNISVTLASPSGLKLPRVFRDEIESTSLTLQEVPLLENTLSTADVIYQTRIQKERFTSNEEYLKYKSCYTIDLPMARKMKPGSLLLHPLPRVDEISTEVDALPHAAYFRQAHYGLYLRMALLEHLLKN